MLCVVSPAKTLDFETALPTAREHQPALIAKAAGSIGGLSKLNDADIANLLKLTADYAYCPKRSTESKYIFTRKQS